jgi:hypothetical protein
LGLNLFPIANLLKFIFLVLGFMSESTGVEVENLAVGGPGLSFIGYPNIL